jgi:hypothetical protein
MSLAPYNQPGQRFVTQHTTWRLLPTIGHVTRSYVG